MLLLWLLEQRWQYVHFRLRWPLKLLVVGVANIGFTPRLPQCTTRSLLHTIQPLYYVPADSQGHLADVVQCEQCVQIWTALSS